MSGMSEYERRERWRGVGATILMFPFVALALMGMVALGLIAWDWAWKS